MNRDPMSSFRDRTRLFPDRDAWLSARCATLGASEAAALLGESPFASPWDVWANKRRGTPIPETTEYNDEGGVDLNDPKMRGQVLEPLVGAAYTAATGRQHRPMWAAAFGKPGDIAITTHATERWLSASLDAITLDLNLGEGCGEWKTAKDSYRWGRDGTWISGTWESFDRVIPMHIGVQALVQLAVSGLAYCDVGVLTGGLCFRHFRVLRHEPTLAALVDELGRLYAHHILDGAEPDVDGSAACIASARAKLAANRTKSRPATEEEGAWIDLLAARKAAAEAAEVARAHILLAVRDCARLTLPPGLRGEPRGVRVSASGSVTPYGF